MTAKATPQMPHLGQLLQQHLKTNKIYRSSLARAMKRTDATLLRYEKLPSFQLRLLWELALALKHNFFADLAAQLPPEYSSNVKPDTAKDERIAALEQQVLILNEKLELLKEVVGK